MTHNQIAARYRKLLIDVLELDNEGDINPEWDSIVFYVADLYSRGMPHTPPRGVDSAILEDMAIHIERIEGV